MNDCVLLVGRWVTWYWYSIVMWVLFRLNCGLWFVVCDGFFVELCWNVRMECEKLIVFNVGFCFGSGVFGWDIWFEYININFVLLTIVRFG